MSLSARGFVPGIVLAAAMTVSLPAPAACLTDAEVAVLYGAYMARQPSPNPLGLSADDAACTRAKFNARLASTLGPVVGYKAGLTNPAVQKRFNATEPVWGMLYAPMMLKSGAAVDAAFGARPVSEGDLLVRIGSESINQARTPEQAMLAIDQVIPAIDLPDLMVEAPSKLDGAAVAAINVAARYFVVGTPIPADRKIELLDALPRMKVVVLGDGRDLDTGSGADVLGHPLNAVVWLAQDLQKHGLALKKGDLVSVGSFSKLLPPKPGMKVEVQYQGLPDNPIVSLTFH